MDTIRIATRNSPLALKQANIVAARLTALQRQLKIEIIPIVSEGDKQLDNSLAEIGGKGLFVKSLEQALLANQADIAVHSMKDVPCEMPDGFKIVAVLTRTDPSDALVSKDYTNLDQLPKRAIVGTSSLRRQCQLKYHYPHLEIQPLRGNIGTRLAKLDSGEYDALILASAGLQRLDLSERIRCVLPHSISLPAIGQGAIGIEVHDAYQSLSYISALNDTISYACVEAERALSLALGGDCRMPIGAYAHHNNGNLHLSSLIGDAQGQQIIRDRRHGVIAQSTQLGKAAADALLAQGAAAILSSFQDNE